MDTLKFALFFIGTIAFFVNLYFAVRHPELVETPGQSKQEVDRHPLRKWDKAATWVMWSGWGAAALLIFLGRVGVLGTPD